MGNILEILGEKVGNGWNKTDFKCEHVGKQFFNVDHMGVDNHESTAIPTVSIAWRVLSYPTVFAQRFVKTLLHITVFRDMA